MLVSWWDQLTSTIEVLTNTMITSSALVMSSLTNTSVMDIYSILLEPKWSQCHNTLMTHLDSIEMDFIKLVI